MMDYSFLYTSVRETQLKGRYITLDSIGPLLERYGSKRWVDVVGSSEKGLPIYSIVLGDGPKRILGWSQMHGNESTTTKALFDFLSFVANNKEGQNLLKAYTFVFLPLLNPDGALLYTRENANGIDLNRDAVDLSQSESRVLRRVFEDVRPDLCLNLHDQRTIYGLSTGKSATVSFLAPAADEALTITPSREIAMAEIVRMNRFLQGIIPGQIGRYDDSFNPNCVGDTFQALGVPTILFEAGHFPGDYQREKTRELIFLALLTLFGGTSLQVNEKTKQAYSEIPENQKCFRDVLLRNLKMNGGLVDMAIQYEEQLQEGVLNFIPTVESLGDLKNLRGHREIDLMGQEILINSHENVFVGEKIVTIKGKTSNKPIIF